MYHKTMSGFALLAVLAACEPDAPQRNSPSPASAELGAEDRGLAAEGKQIFRFDTFGNEQFWTDTLGLHQVIEQSVDPTTALKVGLKVDASVLPPGLLERVDLTDPATTVALLKLNAVVGVQATVDAENHITWLGITCAFCHSTVDNSVLLGIGRRLDGHPNIDLDVGAIVALSPVLTPAQRAVYLSWGPGKYDPRFNIDGQNTPLVIPPAYGLREVRNETYTAEGPISYWNSYVAVTQMHGQGTFIDPRLGISIVQTPDLVTPKLPALRAYQHTLAAPSPRPGSVNQDLARRGRRVFEANCVSCHLDGNGTDNNRGVLHQPAETGMDPAYALRTTTRAYRTTPLRGLVRHPPYFHDGSAPTLDAVVNHYDRVLGLNLSPAEQQALVEYLKTL